MRDYKFRGKRIDNGEWVYGNLVEWLNETKDVSIVAHPFGCCIDEVGNLVLIEEPFVCKVYTETVGQYTGLLDKNGKEIYEGDVVRGGNIAHEKYLVVDIFGTTYSLYQTNPLRQKLRKPYCRLDSRVICDDFSSLETNLEIIGNIHENPELLEVRP